MKIAHVILENASLYERKSQRIDQAALAGSATVTVTSLERLREAAADVVHVYGSRAYLARPDAARRRWFERSRAKRRIEVTPLKGSDGYVPEAVEEIFFEGAGEPPPSPRVGSVDREELRPLVQQTMARIHRFRDDVEWTLFSHPPSPQEIDAMGVWVDPAMEDLDGDGYVAEALVRGVPVVAGRTAINMQRLENGRSGVVVPPRDPNEFTHAILTALFKREVVQGRVEAARQTIAKFRPRQRLRLLLQTCETLLQ
jgi:hypothetical protein